VSIMVLKGGGGAQQGTGKGELVCSGTERRDKGGGVLGCEDGNGGK
jgi:hypothetical protein